MKTMKICLLFLISLLTLEFTVNAQQKIVYLCPSNQSASAALLEKTIQETISGDESISFLSENNPCAYSKSVKSNLNVAINKKNFDLAENHSFSLIKIGEDFFSIEQFTFKTEKQANSISQILSNRKNNMLQTESVTFYACFQIRNNLIFYIADRQVYRNHLPFFQNFKKSFLTEYKSSKKSD